jgi:hypothetical protein
MASFPLRIVLLCVALATLEAACACLIADQTFRDVPGMPQFAVAWKRIDVNLVCMGIRERSNVANSWTGFGLAGPNNPPLQNGMAGAKMMIVDVNNSAPSIVTVLADRNARPNVTIGTPSGEALYESFQLTATWAWNSPAWKARQDVVIARGSGGNYVGNPQAKHGFSNQHRNVFCVDIADNTIEAGFCNPNPRPPPPSITTTGVPATGKQVESDGSLVASTDYASALAVGIVAVLFLLCIGALAFRLDRESMVSSSELASERGTETNDTTDDGPGSSSLESQVNPSPLSSEDSSQSSFLSSYRESGEFPDLRYPR